MGDDSSRPPATGYPVHPPANGYPYPASQPYFYNQTQPPSHQQPSAYYQNYDPNYQRRQLLLRRVVTAFLAVFIILGAILFITWAVLRPQFPQFKVDSASVTGFNLSSTSISGVWDFGLTVVNPDKKVSVGYDLVDAKLAAESTSIVDTALAPFAQGTRNSTAIRVSFAAVGAYVNEKALSAISKERSADGVVGFDLRIYARVSFDAGTWRMRRRLLRVLCDDLKIGVPNGSASGNMTAGAKDCRVDWADYYAVLNFPYTLCPVWQID